MAILESGERLRIVPIPLLDDAMAENLEIQSLTASIDTQSASGARLLEGAMTAEVLVEDDDTPPRLEIQMMATGGGRLLCSGPVGMEFVVETSPDLRSWKPMSGGRITTDGFTAPVAIQLGGVPPNVVFYRLVSLWSVGIPASPKH